MSESISEDAIDVCKRGKRFAVMKKYKKRIIDGRGDDV